MRAGTIQFFLCNIARNKSGGNRLTATIACNFLCNAVHRVSKRLVSACKILCATNNAVRDKIAT